MRNFLVVGSDREDMRTAARTFVTWRTAPCDNGKSWFQSTDDGSAYRLGNLKFWECMIGDSMDLNEKIPQMDCVLYVALEDDIDVSFVRELAEDTTGNFVLGVKLDSIREMMQGGIAFDDKRMFSLMRERCFDIGVRLEEVADVETEIVSLYACSDKGTEGVWGFIKLRW